VSLHAACVLVVCLAVQIADPAMLQQRAREGERALAEKRYADAEVAYEALRRLSPSTAEVHAQLGVIYFQQGKFTQAIASLRKALELKPALPNLHTLLAMSLSEIGRYAEALPLLEPGFARATDPALKRMAGLHLQRAYTGLQRDADAVGVALQLSKLYPDDPEVLYQTGRLFGNYAYLTTMKLAKAAPDSVWLHQAAGEANESQGLYEPAIHEYQEVLKRDPRRPGIHYRIARVLLARAQAATADAERTTSREKALTELEAELAIDPTNANAAYETGEIHRQAGDLARAREAFERAVTHYPEFDEALVALGRTLVALGLPAAAVPHLVKATTLDPSNAVAFYQLAQAYRGVGNSAEQAKALDGYRRLRAEAAQRETPLVRSPTPVTPQQVDEKPVPPAL
jgi:tetratricopeptide (TPR) repeat protein